MPNLSTSDLRRRMLTLWDQFDKGKITAGEARVQIGFARTILETLKVEIAAAHLGATAPALLVGDTEVKVLAHPQRMLPNRKSNGQGRGARQ